MIFNAKPASDPGPWAGEQHDEVLFWRARPDVKRRGATAIGHFCGRPRAGRSEGSALYDGGGRVIFCVRKFFLASTRVELRAAARSHQSACAPALGSGWWSPWAQLGCGGGCCADGGLAMIAGCRAGLTLALALVLALVLVLAQAHCRRAAREAELAGGGAHGSVFDPCRRRLT